MLDTTLGAIFYLFGAPFCSLSLSKALPEWPLKRSTAWSKTIPKQPKTGQEPASAQGFSPARTHRLGSRFGSQTQPLLEKSWELALCMEQLPKQLALFSWLSPIASSSQSCFWPLFQSVRVSEILKEVENIPGLAYHILQHLRRFFCGFYDNYRTFWDRREPRGFLRIVWTLFGWFPCGKSLWENLWKSFKF